MPIVEQVGIVPPGFRWCAKVAPQHNLNDLTFPLSFSLLFCKIIRIIREISFRLLKVPLKIRSSNFLKTKLLFPLAYSFAWIFVKLYYLTCRVQVEGPLEAYLQNGKPLLLTWWHQDMLFNFFYLMRFTKQRKFFTIISQSDDGALAAYLVRKFGIIPIRGSSSKGGRAALERLTATVLEEKGVGVIVCDGPRPPGRVAKPGIVLLAMKTGFPIVKVRSWGERQHIFRRSWCKLLLVYPFSHVRIWSDPPLFVPADVRGGAIETYRLEVEKGLNALADLSEDYFGKRRPAV
jgi:lysophospholipid acyltransferase (LPLAT)-like uncharacterized protein